MNGFAFLCLFVWISGTTADIRHFIPLQASARITDDDIVVLHDADNFVSETTTTPVSLPDLPVPNWSFVISDVVLISYATPEDRDIALQQITQVWQDALAPQVNDVQVVLVDDLPAPSNLSHQYARSKSKANLIIYVVLGNTEDPIDTNAAKLAFRDELAETKIPVTPVNLTSPDATNVVNHATNETFAVLDSVWVKYNTPEERDDLLRRVKTIWESLLAGMAFNVHLTLFGDTPATSEALPHLITYIITGRKLNNEQISDQDVGLKLQFRNLLRSSQYAGLWPVAFALPKLSDVSTTTTATTEKLITSSSKTVVKSPTLSVKETPQPHNTGSPFWITDNLILPYETVDQRNFFLQQIKTLWNKVLGAEATGLDVRFVDSVKADNDTSSSQRIPVYNVTYEVSGWSVDPKILLHALERFHQAVADAQGGGQKDTTTKPRTPIMTSNNKTIGVKDKGTLQPGTLTIGSTSNEPQTVNLDNAAQEFMWSLPQETVQLTAAVDVVTKPPTTVPTTLTLTVETATQDFAQPLSAKINNDLLKIPSFMQALPDDKTAKNPTTVQPVTEPPATTTYASVDAQIQDLIRKRFGGVNPAGMHATVFNENIMFELNTNETSVGEIMEAIRRVWMDAIGSETQADVFLSVVRNDSVQVGPVDSRTTIQNVDYVVLALTRAGDLDVESVRSRFRELLAGAGMTNIIPKTDLFSGLFDRRKVNNNIILGSLSVSFTDKELLSNLTEALQKIWSNVLGSDATDVQVSIYRDAPHAPTTAIAGNELYHDVYYVVLVQTTKSDIDVDTLRDKVRELLPTIDIAGVTVIPPVKHESNDIPGDSSDKTLSKQQTSVNANDPSADPLLGLQLQHRILLNYSTEAQKIDELGQIRQLWFDVFGPDVSDIKLRLDNETTVSTSTDGSALNYIEYTVFVVTKSTNYDQEAVLQKFRHNLRSAFLNFQASEVPEVMVATGRDDSEVFVKLDQPEPIRSVLVYDSVVFLYTTDKEKEQKLDQLKEIWGKSLGLKVVAVHVRPIFDEAVQNSSVHHVEYILVALTNGTALDADEARTGVRKYAASRNQTVFAFPDKNTLLHTMPSTANFAVVPSGILIRYATALDLKNMVQVIQNTWQKVLGQNAPKVDVVVYDDIIRPEDQVVAGDPHPVHYVSYVAVIQTSGKPINIPTVIARFQELLSVGMDRNATKTILVNSTATISNSPKRTLTATVVNASLLPNITKSESNNTSTFNITINLQNPRKSLLLSKANDTAEGTTKVMNVATTSATVTSRTPALSVKMVISKANVSSPTSSKKETLTISPVASAGEPVSVPPLPAALLIKDHIWLVYKSNIERDNYLGQIRDVWKKVLRDFGVSNVSLEFDFEALDHTASNLPNSHKVYYTVLGTQSNKTAHIDTYAAKHRLRQILPTGKFMFGFDVEEVNEFNKHAAQGIYKDIVEEKPPKKEIDEYDEIDAAPVTSKITSNDPKIEIVRSVILQYSDDEERDAEVDQLLLLWNKITRKNVTIIRLSDKILSTDETYAPGSVHEFNYTVQLNASKSSLNKTALLNLATAFENALRLEKFPFVLNGSELIHPVIPERKLVITLGSIIRDFSNVTFNGVPIKNVNFSSIAEQVQEQLQNSSITITPSLNGNFTIAINNHTQNVSATNKSHIDHGKNVVNGSLYIRYFNATDKEVALGTMRNIWKSLFGFSEGLVNLTLLIDDTKQTNATNLLPRCP
ncbi:uncharacterized protein LOC129588442 isoform X2 [Paramacrobiotus metropolitanus]|uniref:uncharacterized protein LOC129588442 isoform X2 n=1 Tax=Paramacrobiotus metropolitanus TaxID=2943436 RepID=UPI002446535A|nr:uncharacterized protein LOC129588442 isoform X2 [Paramacrobiotus metropolitanus]